MPPRPKKSRPIEPLPLGERSRAIEAETVETLDEVVEISDSKRVTFSGLDIEVHCSPNDCGDPWKYKRWTVYFSFAEVGKLFAFALRHGMRRHLGVAHMRPTMVPQTKR